MQVIGEIVNFVASLFLPIDLRWGGGSCAATDGGAVLDLNPPIPTEWIAVHHLYTFSDKVVSDGV